MRPVLTRALCAAAVMFALPTSLSAQEAEPTEAEVRRQGLDEIIVTAQKRKESIKDVPLSVTAISGETIKELNIEDLNDLSRHTPNLKVQASGIFNFIYIRGLGSGLNAGFEQSVGLFIDGMYYGRNHYLTTAFLDLEQVEVLRGPQGTLFGKNTVAGALNITTGTPVHDWAFDADLIMGEAETIRATGMVNVPVWEDFVAFRAAGTHFEREGFIFNHHPDRMEKEAEVAQDVIRLKTLFEFNEDFNFTLLYLQAEASLRGFGDELSTAPDEFLAFFRLFDPATDPVAGDGRNSVNDPSGGIQDSTDIVGTLNLNAFSNTFTAIVGWSEYVRDGQLDADFGPSPSLLVTQRQPYEQWSAELRATSNFGNKFEYVAGLYYFESDLENPTDTRVAPFQNVTGTTTQILAPPIAQAVADGILPDIAFEAEHGTGDFQQFNQTFSVYGQAQYDVFQWLRLIAGARWSKDIKDLHFTQTLTGPGGIPGFAPILQAVLQAEEFDRTDTREETDFSPKVSALYRFNDDVNFYFTFAQGHKAGGFNASASREIDIEFEPENSDTFEFGMKGDFFDGNARLNLGFFHTQFQDLQVSVFNGLEFIVSNADATTKGVEADAMWLAPYGFILVGSFAYLDGTYDDFRNGPCQAEAGSSATDNNEDEDSGTCDLTGGRLANAPEFQWDISVNWLKQVGNLPFNLYAGYDVFYHGDTFFQTDLDPKDFYEGYFMHHARLGVRALDENWSFTIFIRNVTDEVAVLGSGDVPVYSGTHFVRVDQPRNIAAQFRVAF